MSASAATNQGDRMLWWVGEDQPLPGGGALLAAYLSPVFESRHEAERALDELRADHPGAYVMQLTALEPEPAGGAK